ncbi:MAG TPA: hypothetical protein DEB39_11860 [Planctomycetaceae bacterium]|nr:hypothetical protein [Planctomycetaceae bacterium]
MAARTRFREILNRSRHTLHPEHRYTVSRIKSKPPALFRKANFSNNRHSGRFLKTRVRRNPYGSDCYGIGQESPGASTCHVFLYPLLLILVENIQGVKMGKCRLFPF